MSNVMVVPPIMAALVKSEDVIGSQRVWCAVNDFQEQFLEDFFSRRSELGMLSDLEMRSWASWLASELNEILEQEGFSIRLQDFADGEFGVVSILDAMAAWPVEGTAVKLLADDQRYDAVHMLYTVFTDDAAVRMFSAGTSIIHDQPLVRLNTQTGDSLWMSVADRVYADFALVDRIDALRRTFELQNHASWLMFPMVDLDVETNLGWLTGMHTTVGSSVHRAVISQALQQTKFKMNHRGARVRSGVGTGFATTSARLEINEPIVIDEPFFLWIERPGMMCPLMYAYIDEQNWKDPGDLTAM